MSYELSLDPKAIADINDSFGWYEEQRPGLGEQFILDLEACLNAIQRNPMAWPVVHQAGPDLIRRALVKRFPFKVFYDVLENRIRIGAVLHSKRDLSRWRERF